MRRRVTKKLRRRRACATVDGLGLDALPITADIDHRDRLGLHRVLLFGIRVLIFACGSSDLTLDPYLVNGIDVNENLVERILVQLIVILEHFLSKGQHEVPGREVLLIVAGPIAVLALSNIGLEDF